MKKVFLSMSAMALLLTVTVSSCGGKMDVDKAAADFCACKDKEDKKACYTEWAAG